MFKKLLTLIFLLFLWIPVFTGMTRSVYAVDQFATSYDVTYDISESGITTVTEKVNLKNLTSQFYASEFKLTIGATKISDVKASDPGGVMPTEIKQEGTSTTILVKFNQQVAGLGKELPWTLSFKSADFAQKVGKVWEISVPKVTSTSNLQTYNLTVATPLGFGEPTAISPTPNSQSQSSGKRFFTFNKDQLTSSGVSANFGTFQLFDFDLTYNLENPNLVPALTSITLPPDTAYQDVILTLIEPRPLNVTVDNDGNYLAWYRLERNQKIAVKVVGSAKLYTKSKIKNPNLDLLLAQKYTQADKYWDKDNPVIKAKLNEILVSDNPESKYEKARLIHRFVSSYLKYDPSRLSSSGIERLGSVTALNNPSSAVCMEYTDLFITLARAAGIPARELDGFAYTANSTLRPLSLSRDILHSWPEFWDDSRGWVMVDPTWESTTGGVDYFSKFDLNHFVFAIKGSSSQTPAPAGSYKYTDKDSHDVKVNLSDQDFIPKPHTNVEILTSETIWAGFPGKITVRFSNNGNGLQQSEDFSVTTTTLDILEAGTQKSGPIPFFGYAQFEYNLRTKSLLDSYSDEITVNFAGQKYTKTVNIKPLFHSHFTAIVIFIFIGLMLLIYFTVLSRYIYRRRALKLAEDVKKEIEKKTKKI